MHNIELLSIDLSNYCTKGCTFCYNSSNKDGSTLWQPHEVIVLAKDCVSHGVKAISLGGGEPFEYDGIFEVIDAIYPIAYLSVTTNGLPLEKDEVWQQLLLHKPDKIHITIHQSDDEQEVLRVIKQLSLIQDIGVKPGVNLLVPASKIEDCQKVYLQLRQSLLSDQIILVPQRFSDTPTAKQLASVAHGEPFQSPSCLLKCQVNPTFASISWDKKVSHCSYQEEKIALTMLDYAGVVSALSSANKSVAQRHHS